MTWHYRPHLESLEQEYLQMPDGRCVLPVAYMLAYGHWMDKRIGQWIEKLEARLDDEQLTGDRRVNWLIARAQAEEIRRSTPGRDDRTIDRFLAGRGWLEEATLVAESEPVRLRAYQELAARFTAQEQLDAARAILDHAARRCTSEASSDALGQWRETLDAVGLTFEERRQERETRAQDAYRQKLRARRPAGPGTG